MNEDHVGTGQETLAFLRGHEVGVLSTLDRHNKPSGATVYYTLDDGHVYILTKQSTTKAHNMMTNQDVALTVYDTDSLQTVQLQGVAEVETDREIKETVFRDIVRLRHSATGRHFPPVTTIHDGAYVVFKISPSNFSFSDFAG
jgi:general stress protein 26